MKSLRKIIRDLVKENMNRSEDDYEIVNKEDFEEALSDLATLDLEDDQVRIPEFDEDGQPPHVHSCRAA